MIVKNNNDILKDDSGSLIEVNPKDVALDGQVAWWEFDYNLNDSIGSYNLGSADFIGGFNDTPPYIYDNGGALTYTYDPRENKSVKLQSIFYPNGGTGLDNGGRYRLLHNADVIQDILNADSDASIAVSMWLKLDSSAYRTSGVSESYEILDTTGYVLNNGSQAANRLWFGIESDASIDTNYYKIVSSYGDMNEYFDVPNDYHHIVVTRDASYGRLYVDASLRAEVLNPNPLSTSKIANHWDASVGLFINGYVLENFDVVDNHWYAYCDPNKGLYSQQYDASIQNDPVPLNDGYVHIGSTRVFSKSLTESEVNNIYYNGL